MTGSRSVDRRAPIARRERRGPATRAACIGAALAFLLAACASPTGSRAAPTWPARTASPSMIRIGSFDFTESAVLGELYGQALEAKGYRVAFHLNLGSREVVDPALEQGFVDLVPEYMGSALAFATLGRNTGSRTTVAAGRRALAAALAPRGLVALASARASDENAVVVTATTARAHGLAAISQLRPLAHRMVFGAPPECMVRDLCLKGLEAVYDLDFARIRPLDASGSYVIDALRSDAIQVGLLFSTDPRLEPDRQGTNVHIVQLRDDRELQPPENVTPIMRRDVLARFGPGVAAAIDAVSARLTTLELTDLNAAVTFDRRSPADVAADWLRAEGLA
jgi:osmoprotectant transport system substrate-binding protein